MRIIKTVVPIWCVPYGSMAYGLINFPMIVMLPADLHY